MDIKNRVATIYHEMRKDRDNSNIAINMSINGICKLMSTFVGYIYVPVVMRYLGVNKYGVWATILSILSWIGYFDIGISNGLRNKLTEAMAKNEVGNEKKLISSAYAFIALVMIIVAILFEIVALRIDWETVFGVTNIDEDLRQIVNVSFLFVTANFVLSICKSVMFAFQKAAYVSVMGLATQIVNLCGVLFISQFLYENLFAMACVYGMAMVLVSFVGNIVIYHKYRNIRPRLKFVEFKAGISLTSLGIQFFIVQICGLVLFTTDNLIISHLYGSMNVTPYTTVNKVFNIISSSFTVLLAPVWSSVTKAKTQHNFIWLKKLIQRLNLLMFPFFICIVILAFVFRPLANWWLGIELNYEGGLIIFGAIYCALTIWCNTYAYIANGLELMRMSMAVAIVQAAVNIPLSLFFAQVWDMKSTGVLLGTIISMSISAIVSPVFIKKRIDFEIR